MFGTARAERARRAARIMLVADVEFDVTCARGQVEAGRCQLFRTLNRALKNPKPLGGDAELKGRQGRG
jgi:hypothetical protein